VVEKAYKAKRNSDVISTNIVYILMKKYVILGILTSFFFLGLGIYQFFTLNNGKLQVTVCDVGQGDAVVIRTPEGHTILFDGGPDKSVLQCLRKALPFWERRIGLILLSHPHADHLNGLIDVLKTYSVGQFATEDLANTSDGYKALQEIVRTEGLSWQSLVSGDKIKLDSGVVLTVVGPTKEFLSRTAVGGKYITSSEFASLEILLTYQKFSFLLTGDSQYQEMGESIAMYKDQLSRVTLLQTPHHGSRSGITPEIIAVLHPQVGMISVGAHNSYGHPAPSTLVTLQNAGVKIYRTDKEGTLRVISDGKSYNLQ
jgi:competence protein ComEC